MQVGRFVKVLSCRLARIFATLTLDSVFEDGIHWNLGHTEREREETLLELGRQLGLGGLRWRR